MLIVPVPVARKSRCPVAAALPRFADRRTGEAAPKPMLEHPFPLPFLNGL